MTVVVPIGKQKPLVKLLVTEGAVVQLSVAVGAAQVVVAQVAAVVKLMLVGQAERTGFVTSFVQGSPPVTATMKLQVAVTADSLSRNID